MDISNIFETITHIDTAYLSQRLIDIAPKLISLLISSIIIALFIAFIFREVRKKFSDRELKFGRAHFILGCSCFILSAFGIWSFFDGSYYTGDINSFYLICIFSTGFGIGSLYILIEHVKIHGLYNSESIVFSSPWTGTKKENWCDLVIPPFLTLVKSRVLLSS